MANKSTGIYGHFGNYAAAAQLPNVVGATVQTAELAVGDLASVAGILYVCTTATLGAAVWAVVGSGVGAAVESDAWVPTLTDTAAVVNFTQPLASYYTRVNGTTPVVTAHFIFSYDAVANGTPSVDVTNLPYALAGTTDGTFNIAASVGLLPSFPDVNTLRILFAAPLTIGNSGVIYVTLAYEPAA